MITALTLSAHDEDVGLVEVAEDDLDVEHQERHRENVEPHVEALPRRADRIHAGLVGESFDRTLGLRSDDRGEHEVRNDEDERHQDDDADREIPGDAVEGESGHGWA